MRDFLSEYRTEILFSLVGIVAPYVVAAIIRFVKGLVSRRRLYNSPNAALVGGWHAFHFSRISGVPIVRHEIWMVRVDFRGHLAVKAHDPGVSTLSYAGVLRPVDSGHLVCLMRGVGHHEESYMRLQHPIPSQQEIYGIEAAVNFDREIRATVWLLSREDLDPNIARRFLERKADTSYQVETRSITLSSP